MAQVLAECPVLCNIRITLSLAQHTVWINQALFDLFNLPGAGLLFDNFNITKSPSIDLAGLRERIINASIFWTNPCLADEVTEDNVAHFITVIFASRIVFWVEINDLVIHCRKWDQNKLEILTAVASAQGRCHRLLAEFAEKNANWPKQARLKTRQTMVGRKFFDYVDCDSRPGACADEISPFLKLLKSGEDISWAFITGASSPRNLEADLVAAFNWLNDLRWKTKTFDEHTFLHVRTVINSIWPAMFYSCRRLVGWGGWVDIDSYHEILRRKRLLVFAAILGNSLCPD